MFLMLIMYLLLSFSSNRIRTRAARKLYSNFKSPIIQTQDIKTDKEPLKNRKRQNLDGLSINSQSVQFYKPFNFGSKVPEAGIVQINTNDTIYSTIIESARIEKIKFKKKSSKYKELRKFKDPTTIISQNISSASTQTPKSPKTRSLKPLSEQKKSSNQQKNLLLLKDIEQNEFSEKKLNRGLKGDIDAQNDAIQDRFKTFNQNPASNKLSKKDKFLFPTAPQRRSLRLLSKNARLASPHKIFSNENSKNSQKDEISIPFIFQNLTKNDKIFFDESQLKDCTDVKKVTDEISFLNPDPQHKSSLTTFENGSNFCHNSKNNLTGTKYIDVSVLDPEDTRSQTEVKHVSTLEKSNEIPCENTAGQTKVRPVGLPQILSKDVNHQETPFLSHKDVNFSCYFYMDSDNAIDNSIVIKNTLNDPNLRSKDDDKVFSEQTVTKASIVSAVNHNMIPTGVVNDVSPIPPTGDGVITTSATLYSGPVPQADDHIINNGAVVDTIPNFSANNSLLPVSATVYTNTISRDDDSSIVTKEVIIGKDIAKVVDPVQFDESLFEPDDALKIDSECIDSLVELLPLEINEQFAAINLNPCDSKNLELTLDPVYNQDFSENTPVISHKRNFKVNKKQCGIDFIKKGNETHSAPQFSGISISNQSIYENQIEKIVSNETSEIINSCNSSTLSGNSNLNTQVKIRPSKNCQLEPRCNKLAPKKENLYCHKNIFITRLEFFHPTLHPKIVHFKIHKGLDARSLDNKKIAKIIKGKLKINLKYPLKVHSYYSFGKYQFLTVVFCSH